MFNTFGLPVVKEYDESNNKPGKIIPIRSISKSVPIEENPTIPYAINSDEVFVPLSPYYTRDSQTRYIISNYGRLYDLALQKFILPRTTSSKYDYNSLDNGYRVIRINRFIDPYTTENYDILLHRAMMISFNYFPGCDEFEVKHINGNFADNRLCNLQWITKKDNIKHSIENQYRQIDNFTKTPDEKSIRNICQMLDNGYSPNYIASFTGEDIQLIHGLINGAYYRDIAAGYKFFYKYRCNMYPEELIRDICKKLSEGINPKDISYEHGIDGFLVLDILHRKIYTDISKDYNFTKADYSNMTGFDRKLTEKQVTDICVMLSRDLSINDIIMKFKMIYGIELNPNVIINIRTGKTYTDITDKFMLERKNTALDESVVRNICNDIQSGLSNNVISSKYNISAGTIGRIRRRETYTDISKDYNFLNADEAARLANNNDRLSDALVINICNLLMNRETPTNVANKLGVKLSTVNNIKNHTGYTHISKNYDFPMLENRLSEDTIRNICKDIFIYRMRNIDIISKYRVSADTVKRIKSGKMHKDISKEYIQ